MKSMEFNEIAIVENNNTEFKEGDSTLPKPRPCNFVLNFF